MEERAQSFGYWLRRRRKALDLTQEALARAVSCSRFAIRKIEADERRPSRRLAGGWPRSSAFPTRSARPSSTRRARSGPREQLQGRRNSTSPRNEGSNELPGPETKRSPFVGRGAEFGLLIGLLARLTAGLGTRRAARGRARHRQDPADAGARPLLRGARSLYARDELLRDRARDAVSARHRPRRQGARACIGRGAGASWPRCRSPSSRRWCPQWPSAVAVPELSNDFPEARQARRFRAMVQLFEALARRRARSW